MIEISINKDNCTMCGRCAKVCPSMVFARRKVGAEIDVVSPQSCIVCGHCAGACADNAIVHSEFPANKVHKIDYAQLPSPEQVMLLCKVRRSNRAFTKKPVPAESLDLILEAAHRAPTGSNMQNLSFTLITREEDLKKIIDYTMNVFGQKLKMLKNPILAPIIKRAIPGATRYIPVFERIQREYYNGNDPILRGATSVIFFHTPKGSAMGDMDANLAYQNGSLMAESLGVSQFYTGFVLNALKQDKKARLADILGINGTINAGMALGVPAFRFPNYIDRKDIAVDKK